MDSVRARCRKGVTKVGKGAVALAASVTLRNFESYAEFYAAEPQSAYAAFAKAIEPIGKEMSKSPCDWDGLAIIHEVSEPIEARIVDTSPQPATGEIIAIGDGVPWVVDGMKDLIGAYCASIAFTNRMTRESCNFDDVKWDVAYELGLVYADLSQGEGRNTMIASYLPLFFKAWRELTTLRNSLD